MRNDHPRLDFLQEMPYLSHRCSWIHRLCLKLALTSFLLVPITNFAAADRAWFNDSLPDGARPSGNWKWVNSDPAPFAGTRAHRTGLTEGLHEQMFNWASDALSIREGDVLFTHIYVDPENPPRQIMLSWRAEDWEHRAYWGESLVPYGTENTTSRRHMGPLPPAGQWVRLEIPADAVGLAGKTVRGMSFTLYDGAATWDMTGKFYDGEEEAEPVSHLGSPDSNG